MIASGTDNNTENAAKISALKLPAPEPVIKIPSFDPKYLDTNESVPFDSSVLKRKNSSLVVPEVGSPSGKAGGANGNLLNPNIGAGYGGGYGAKS